jgi:hypothetical protein
MAKLHVTELRGYGTTQKDADVQSLPGDDVLATQAVTVSATHVESSVFNVNTSLLYLVAGSSCAVAFGVSPVAAAGGTFIPVGGTLYVTVPAGESWLLSVIADAL